MGIERNQQRRIPDGRVVLSIGRRDKAAETRLQGTEENSRIKYHSRKISHRSSLIVEHYVEPQYCDD